MNRQNEDLIDKFCYAVSDLAETLLKAYAQGNQEDLVIGDSTNHWTEFSDDLIRSTWANKDAMLIRFAIDVYNDFRARINRQESRPILSAIDVIYRAWELGVITEEEREMALTDVKSRLSNLGYAWRAFPYVTVTNYLGSDGYPTINKTEYDERDQAGTLNQLSLSASELLDRHIKAITGDSMICYRGPTGDLFKDTVSHLISTFLT